MEGENWLGKVVFWYPHLSHGMCLHSPHMDTHTQAPHLQSCTSLLSTRNTGMGFMSGLACTSVIFVLPDCRFHISARFFYSWKTNWPGHLVVENITNCQTMVNVRNWYRNPKPMTIFYSNFEINKDQDKALDHPFWLVNSFWDFLFIGYR